MRVLTDTHTLVWALSDPAYLSGPAREALSGGQATASVANLWELLLKHGKQDALVTDPIAWWERNVSGSGIPVLAIRASHVVALGRLPEIHKDPFDRILIAQSVVEKIPLVSKDSHLAAYRVPLIW